MPVYERTAGLFRVVVWANGKQHERTVRGGSPLALDEEERMRDELGAKPKRDQSFPVEKFDAGEVVWIGGAKTFVYFIQEEGDGPIKIGVGTNAGLRLRELQIGTPRQLHLRCVVPGGRLLERTIHRAFERSRIQGEWFRPTQDLLALVDELSSVSRRTGRKPMAAQRSA